MPLSMWLFVGAVAAFTLAAAVSDLRTRRLPNWLTVPAFAAGMLFHGVTAGWAGLGSALGGFAVGFGILLVLWLIGGGGGGDVKLMGALGAWLGPLSTLMVFFLSALLAVVGTVGVIGVELLRDGYRKTRGKYLPRPSERHERSRRRGANDPEQRRASRRVMPYAAPVALATWLVLAWRIVQR